MWVFSTSCSFFQEEAAAAKEAEEQQKAALAAEAECARVEGLEAAQQGSSGDLRTSHDGGETQKDGGQSYKMSTKEKQAQKMSVHSAAIAASVVVGHKEDKGRTSTFPGIANQILTWKLSMWNICVVIQGSSRVQHRILYVRTQTVNLELATVNLELAQRARMMQMRTPRT